MIPFTRNSRKNELMCRNRKQIGSHLGTGWRGGGKEQETELKRSTGKLLKGEWICSLSWLW